MRLNGTLEDIARLSLSLGAIFAWVLVVPLGPVAGRMAGQPAGQAFALFHGLGLIGLGVAGWAWPYVTGLYRWLGVVGALVGAGLALAPGPVWWVGLAVGGFTTAGPVLEVGTALAGLRRSMRGLAVALGAVVANVPLYFAGLPVALLPDRAWAFLLAAGPAVPALVLRRQGGPVRRSVPWVSILTLLVPIFFIYLVGGLMYALIVPTLSPLGQWMGVLPYILLLPVAGLLTWRGHRLWTGRLGPALLGLGYALWAFLPSAQREILSQVFIVGAFAFVDVFFWTLLADHRGPPSVAFGLGLGAMALAIYAGMALTDVVVLASAGREPLAAAAATVFLLLAVAFLPAWLPAVSQGQEAAFLVPDPGLSVKAGRWGLTEREAEVLRLVALGMSNKEIATRLGISGATVAKHLERIYRKMGVRGRTEALRYFLPTASGDPASGEGEG